MAVKVTLLEPGDVIEADKSWCVYRPESDDLKTLMIHQNVKRVEDKTQPLERHWNNAHLYEAYPADDFVDMEGLNITDSVLMKRGEDYVPFEDVLAEAGVSVLGKRFLVVDTKPGVAYDPKSRLVTARELSASHEIVPDGVTVKFNQRAKFTVSPEHVFDVKIVGRMEPTYKPFKPV